MKETDIEMRNPHTREILKVLKKNGGYMYCCFLWFSGLLCGHSSPWAV